MTCDVWRERIDAFVDAELSSERAAEMAAHVSHCISCSRESILAFQMKRATQLAGRSFMATPDFRAKVRRQLGGQKTWRSGILKPLAAMAAVLVVAASTWLFQANDAAMREVVDVHIATLASSNPVDVISTDRHTVKPWFAGRIPFAFNLPAPEGTEFTLIGGKMAYLRQAAGAQLIYGYQKHRISVFIFNEQSSKKMIATNASTTFATEAWSFGGLRFIAVGDVSASTMNDLRKMFEAAR